MAVQYDYLFRNRYIYRSECDQSKWEETPKSYIISSYDESRPITISRDKPEDLKFNKTPLGPFWRREIDYGFILNNEANVRTCDSFGHMVKSRQRFSESVSYPYTYPKFLPPWETHLRNKIKETKVNLAGYIGEYKETAGLFEKTAKALYQVYRIARGHLPRGVQFKPSHLEDVWLSNAFLVQPMLADLTKSLDELNRVNRPLVVRFSSYLKESEKDSYTHGGWICNREITDSNRTVVHVEFEKRWQDKIFTPGNVLEAGWEGIPFSFVIDWAIPVGDWLASIDALRGVVRMQGSRSYKRVQSVVAVDHEIPTFRVETYPTSLYTDYNRTVFTTIPMGAFPTWEPSLSWRRIVTGTALLRKITLPGLYR
jgi:hypothetical protein